MLKLLSNLNNTDRLKFGLMVFCLGIGVFLRVQTYWNAGELNNDESANASFTEYNSLSWYTKTQFTYAPGYALIRKITVSLFGSSILSHRLPSICFSLLSIALFVFLVWRFFSIRAGWLAIGFYAVAANTIEFSMMAKQYSLDQFIFLLLVTLTFWCAEDLRPRRIQVLTAVAAVAFWLSFPAMFLLPAIALFLFYHAWKNPKLRSSFLLFAGVCFLSFCLLYLLVLRYKVNHTANLTHWSQHFMPMSFWTYSGRQWLSGHFLSLFSSVERFPWPSLMLGIGTIGVFELARRQFLKVWVLILPIFTVLAASSVKAYPFSSRCLIFLLPALCLAVSFGLAGLDRTVRGRGLFAMLAGVVFLYSMFENTQETLRVRLAKYSIGAKQAIDLLKQEAKPEDLILVRESLATRFRSYLKFGNAKVGKDLLPYSPTGRSTFLTPDPEKLNYLRYGNYSGRMNHEEQKELIHHTQNHRDKTIWIVHHHKHAGEIDMLLAHFRSKGSLETYYKQQQASLYRVMPTKTYDY